MGAGSQSGFSPSGESGLEHGLTPIHQRIHCAAIPDSIEPEDELDGIAINNFLDTLAEVAMAVARRREQLDS